MDGTVIIGTELNTKSFDAQIKQLEKKLEILEKSADESNIPEKFRRSAEETRNLNVEIEKTKNKINDLRKKQSDLLKSDLFKMPGTLLNIGNSVEKITKKVIKWGIAVFSVRSAYMFIRQSVSTLSQYDDQMATNIEYIRWALATTIKPLIEWIIKAVYNILGFIGSIVKSIFNVNIFANASADAFIKAKKSIGDSNKEAKKLQKTLAGFDEINILSKDGTVNQIGMPNIDLGNVFDIGKTNKIKRFWEDIFNFWEHDWEKFFNSFDGNWSSFIYGLGLTLKGLYDIISGIGEVFWGVGEMIVGVFMGDFEIIKEGFGVMIDGIKRILKGVLEGISGLLMTVIGTIKGIFLDLVDWIYKNIIKPIGDFFGGLWNGIKKGVVNAVNAIKDAFKGIADWIYKNTIKPVVDFFTYLADKIIKIFEGIFDGIKKAFNELKNSIERTTHPYTPTLWNTVSGWIKRTFGFAKGGIVVPKLASGGIINQPGRGVPIGSAIGGERGAEGVIPLTDSQQMELLGEAIGKYITINANIVNTMNGRVISRELQRVQNDSNFAYNR